VHCDLGLLVVDIDDYLDAFYFTVATLTTTDAVLRAWGDR